MKKQILKILAFCMIITGVFYTPVISHAEEKSDMIAGEDEMAPSQSVGDENMVSVYAKDLKEGIYSIEVESSSSMFRIVEAELTVKDESMTAVITLSGTGYSKLYMGTGEQAVEAEETDYIEYVENEEGAYTYTVPVEALDKKINCCAFSKRKEKWYDRELVFSTDTLPETAWKKAAVQEEIKAEDGTYTMEVTLTGGSGKANIVSPTEVKIENNMGVAEIEWSSPYYDYMIVNGEKFLPVNTEGNSVFEIPIWTVDKEMQVTADTTAMSTPHEIEYTLTFHSDTLKSSGNTAGAVAVTIAVFVAAGVIVAILAMQEKKKGVHE